jgi:hypothetical protein
MVSRTRLLLKGIVTGSLVGLAGATVFELVLVAQWQLKEPGPIPFVGLLMLLLVLVLPAIYCSVVAGLLAILSRPAAASLGWLVFGPAVAYLGYLVASLWDDEITGGLRTVFLITAWIAGRCSIATIRKASGHSGIALDVQQRAGERFDPRDPKTETDAVRAAPQEVTEPRP